MKKSKILVPAVALLALSTAAATTGTVAWFTTNTTVSASNITMSVSTAKDLRISENHVSADATSWQTKLTWNNNISSANPVAAVDGSVTSVTKTLGEQTDAAAVTSVGFIKPNEGNTINADGTASTPITTGTDLSAKYENAVADGHYVAHDYSLRYTGTAGTTQVTFVITVGSGGNDEINKAFRVGVLDSSVSAPQKMFTAYKLTGFAVDKYVLNLGNITLTNNVAYHLSVYTWYEGTDPACINANAVTRSLSISLSHSIVNS
ncbi:MAG: hypothetical protein SO206_05895 [Bacilli bacterium]|nr:hypothetical protein [Bacilli bacterium]